MAHCSDPPFRVDDSRHSRRDDALVVPGSLSLNFGGLECVLYIVHMREQGGTSNVYIVSGFDCFFIETKKKNEGFCATDMRR